jgi:hypothetical protein
MINTGAETQATLTSQRIIVAAMLLVAFVGVVARIVLPRGRLGWHSRPGATIGEILLGCEQLSTELLGFFPSERGDQPFHGGWERQHVRLVLLEWQATEAANAAREPCEQRSLDQLAAALIALRGALEADMRLCRQPGIVPELRRAVDDAVITRCRDLMISARTIGGMRHSGPVQGRDDDRPAGARERVSGCTA